MSARPSLRRVAGALAAALAGIGLVALPTAPATAAVGCTTVEGVFARGSGQDLDGREATKFTDELRARISAPTTIGFYELGTLELDGSRYPAVPVGTGSWDAATNSVGAKVGAGYAYGYGDSVHEGVLELISYLYGRGAECPDMLFVLGGYSQGAQVVGQTYRALTDSMRERIVFNALFGDPKLHLPEGEGVRPPACRGKDLSPWRRTIGDCRTDNGSLGARKPYLPAGWEDTSGLWCNNDDFVCGSSKFAWVTSGHMTYGDEGGAIEEAAREIAERLKARVPADRAADFDTSIHVIGVGTTGLDVMFVLDSTGSMWGRIEGAKAYASRMADVVAAARGRVALVEYRDAGDDFVAVTRVPLTSDVEEFRTALAAVTPNGGGDAPEALLAALMEGFDTLDWRPGATKAAVVLTDDTYHDPDVATGVTLPEVARRSLEIDPVNVYPVVPSYLADTYAPLAEQTSGQVIVDSGDTEAALEEALTRIANRPVVLLEQTSYLAQPGDEVTFDASRSYVLDAEITQYDWDVDGDGVFDATTTEPRLDHVYTAELDGIVQVRATASNGTIASFSAPVTVSSTPPAETRPAAPTGVTATVTTTVDGQSEVLVTWKPADDRAASWGLTVDGVPVATTELTSLTLTEVRRSADTEIGVVGFSADGEIGRTAVTVVPAEGDTTDPSTPVDPTDPADPTTPADTAGPGTSGPAATTGTTTQAAKVLGATEARGLAATGAQLARAVGFAAALLAAGAGLVLVVARQRRRQAD